MSGFGATALLLRTRSTPRSPALRKRRSSWRWCAACSLRCSGGASCAPPAADSVKQHRHPLDAFNRAIAHASAHRPSALRGYGRATPPGQVRLVRSGLSRSVRSVSCCARGQLARSARVAPRRVCRCRAHEARTQPPRLCSRRPGDRRDLTNQEAPPGASPRSSNCEQYSPTHSLGVDRAITSCMARTYCMCRSCKRPRSALDTAKML